MSKRSTHAADEVTRLRTPHARGRPLSEGRQQKKTADWQSTGRGTAQASSEAYRTLGAAASSAAAAAFFTTNAPSKSTLALVGSGSAAFFFLRVAPLAFFLMAVAPGRRPAPGRQPPERPLTPAMPEG